MSYTAINNIPSYLGTIITQVAHGFQVGNPLRFDGANYQLAKADSLNDAAMCGLCSFVLALG